MTADLKAQKRALRSELIAARARLSQEERAQRSLEVAERLDALELLAGARAVALYASLGTEVDSAPLARRLQSRGLRVLYPRTSPGDRRLDFCACSAGDLQRGPLGAFEPPPGARAAALDEIDLVVLPGVGFSLDGLRLGRGGGYYDFTLKLAPRARRVGVGFELQLLPTLPRAPHDVPLDAVVTEARTLLFPSKDPS